jgi:AraC-like DNA-binding protein
MWYAIHCGGGNPYCKWLSAHIFGAKIRMPSDHHSEVIDLVDAGGVRSRVRCQLTLGDTLPGDRDEVTEYRIDATFAIHQHAQLLLEVLPGYIAQTCELPPGWLRALTDERLRPAPQSMHAEPGRPWRLDELDRASSMSRTSFAERFRVLAGVPPLTYLNAWRMQLAQRALRDRDTRVRGVWRWRWHLATPRRTGSTTRSNVKSGCRRCAPRARRSESDRRKSR